MKAIQNTKTDRIIQTKASVGRILLSRDCEITDISDELKSCPGQIPDRTVLFDTMSLADRASLEEICSAPSPRYDRIILKLHIAEYRYGYALRSGSGSRSVTLFLFKSFRDLLDLGRDVLGHLPRLSSIMCDSYSGLFSDANVLCPSEASVLLRLISRRFSKEKQMISSQINFSENDGSSNGCTSGGCIPSGPLALIFSALLSILDSASIDGQLNVSVSSLADCFEVRMNTICSPKGKVFGEFTDILLLQDHLKGALPRLSLAATAAVEYGIPFYASVSPMGNVSFIIEYIPELMPPLEFKFDEPESSSKVLAAAALRLLSLL